jgi:hypothetical protein
LFSHTFVSADAKGLREAIRDAVRAKKKARLGGDGPLLVGIITKKVELVKVRLGVRWGFLACSNWELRERR